MEMKKLDGFLLARLLHGGAANLKAYKQTVNDLNVFPIPDGDTGDNMFLTINAGATAAGEGSENLSQTAGKAASGMLLGARGNSGVILSRIFAGLAKGFEGAASVDVRELGAAFDSGVTEAYGAVSVPVEGTILTVLKDSVAFANKNLTAESTLQSYFDDFNRELKRSLERTPDLLDVLREAGVVDSGGAGLYYIIEGMRKALDSEEEDIREANETLENSDYALINDKNGVTDRLDENDKEAFGYCTEFLLQVMPSKCHGKVPKIEQVEKWLTSIGGESIVAFMEGDIIKVHVHTRTPGKVLDHFQKYGEYLKLKIENMTLQNKNVHIRNNFPSVGEKADEENRKAGADAVEKAPVLTVEKPVSEYAFVAVAAGDGLSQVFRDGGADCVVDGGQSNNPSAQTFIEAFKTVRAKTIVVLPNNKNIILTANQAAELYTDSKVVVFPSRTVGEGYAALACADSSSTVSPDEMLKMMEESSAGVATGYVSKAVRDSATGSIKVTAGDYVGFEGGEILSDDKDIEKAAEGLCEKLSAGEHDLVIVLSGENRTEEDAEKLCNRLSAKFPGTEFAPAAGGQPIYDFIMIFE